MSLGLVGRKVGMTRIFTDDGAAVPVTVLDVANNRITQIKTQEADGYTAVQLTYGKRRASRVSKPQAGHLAKAGVEAGEGIRDPDAGGQCADCNLRVGARQSAAVDRGSSAKAMRLTAQSIIFPTIYGYCLPSRNSQGAVRSFISTKART